MTTYTIGVFVLALLYGLFWNNRTASELARPDNRGTQPDEGATRTGLLSTGGNQPRGGDTAPYLGHQSQRSIS